MTRAAEKTVEVGEKMRNREDFVLGTVQFSRGRGGWWNFLNRLLSKEIF